MNVQLATRLRHLRLSGMVDALPGRAAQAQAAPLGHVEFFELLVEDELTRRADRLFARRLKQAGIVQVQTLSGESRPAGATTPIRRSAATCASGVASHTANSPSRSSPRSHQPCASSTRGSVVRTRSAACSGEPSAAYSARYRRVRPSSAPVPSSASSFHHRSNSTQPGGDADPMRRRRCDVSCGMVKTIEKLITS